MPIKSNSPVKLTIFYGCRIPTRGFLARRKIKKAQLDIGNEPYLSQQ